MENKKQLSTIFYLLLMVFSADLNHHSVSTALTDARIRHARVKCLQKFPQAEIANYTNTLDTQCFLHCYVYEVGLMDLKTRSLNTDQFIEIWEQIEEAFQEDTCLDTFDFSEPLSGTCSDSYRKLMEFRDICVELFEYTFTTTSTWKPENSNHIKKLGQSATEFCELIQADNDAVAENNSEDSNMSILSQYKNKLQCIFENIYYLDAYGRIDELEINLSYKEAEEDSLKSQAIIRSCSHRANAKFRPNNLGFVVLELQKCLKADSKVFEKVLKHRDEISRQY